MVPTFAIYLSAYQMLYNTSHCQCYNMCKVCDVTAGKCIKVVV